MKKLLYLLLCFGVYASALSAQPAMMPPEARDEMAVRRLPNSEASLGTLVYRSGSVTIGRAQEGQGAEALRTVRDCTRTGMGVICKVVQRDLGTLLRRMNDASLSNWLQDHANG